MAQQLERDVRRGLGGHCEDAAEVDYDRVLITGRLKVRGLRGGVPVDQRFWAVMDLREGKVSRAQIHTDRAEALEAARLRG